MGLASSIYNKPVTVEATPAINAKILTNDLTFTTDEFGGGERAGAIRIQFSFTTAADADMVITLTKKGAADLLGSPLTLNSDQNFVIKSKGLYRFDVDVLQTDLINLSSSIALTAINELQIDKVVFGA